MSPPTQPPSSAYLSNGSRHPLVVPVWAVAAVPVVLCVALAMHPDFFERKLFLSELLCLMGLMALWARPVIVRGEVIRNLVLAFLGFGLLRLTLVPFGSGPHPAEWKEFAIVLVQQGSMVYGALAALVGWWAAPYLPAAWRRLRVPVGLLVVGALVLIPWVYARELAAEVKYDVPLHRYSPVILFPLISYVGAVVGVVLVVGLGVWFALGMQALTSLVAVVVVPVVAFLPRWMVWAGVALAVIAFGAALVYTMPWLELVQSSDSSNAVMAADPLMRADSSITWRLILAWEVLVLHWPENLWGVGFGTPLMDYFPLEERVPNPEMLPYKMSPHNSVLAVFARMGVIGAGIFVAIWGWCVDHYLRHRATWRRLKLEPVAWSLVIVIATALFNPYVDTPVQVGVHWFLVGVFGRMAMEVSGAAKGEKVGS